MPSYMMAYESRGRRMTQLLVRDLQVETVQRLKVHAQRRGRSLQGELEAILEAAAGYSPEEARAVSQAWQARLAGREFSDSAEMIREDRERRRA